MIDLRYTKQAIEQFLNEVNSKYCIILDVCFNKIVDIINRTKVEKVIVVSPTNSASKILKFGDKVQNFIKGNKLSIQTNKKYIDWNSFITDRKNSDADIVKFSYNAPTAIVHTGGTTGIPKGVLLSNENFNNVVLQIKNSSVNANRGYRFLNIMPPFIAYGIALGLNTAITLGWHTIIIPKFEANKFDELLLKYEPNGIMGVPVYWENVMKSNKMKNKDLSYIKNILLGGDRVNPEFEKRLDDFLIAHNCNAGVGKGYSMKEASACTTFSTKDTNELGSVGIPLSKTIVSVFKPNTTEELPYNEIGEICINTPTMMLEYFKNTEETDKVKLKHKDGYWIHSGDLGYINENGIVFVKDRIKRMIVRSGFKVFPSELENLFLNHYAVDACSVVGIPDIKDVTAPKVCIVLKAEYTTQKEKINKELIEMFKKSTLPEYFEPIKYEFLDKLPFTDIGKVNYKELEKVNEQLVEEQK